MSMPLSMLKKFRMNVRAALGSDAGLNGKRRKGMSRARIENMSGATAVSNWVSCRLTSGLQLVCASPQQLLNLFRFDLFARPRIIPQWLGWWGRYCAICVGILLL